MILWQETRLPWDDAFNYILQNKLAKVIIILHYLHIFRSDHWRQQKKWFSIFIWNLSAGAGIPEGENLWVTVVIGGHNLPFPGWNMVNWSAKNWGSPVAPLSPPVPASLRCKVPKRVLGYVAHWTSWVKHWSTIANPWQVGGPYLLHLVSL